MVQYLLERSRLPVMTDVAVLLLMSPLVVGFTEKNTVAVNLLATNASELCTAAV